MINVQAECDYDIEREMKCFSKMTNMTALAPLRIDQNTKAPKNVVISVNNSSIDPSQIHIIITGKMFFLSLKWRSGSD